MIDRTRRTRTRLTSVLGLGLVAALALSSCAAPEQGTESGTAGSSSLMLAADNGSPTFVKNFNPFVIEKRTASTIINEPLMVVNALDGKSTNFLQTNYTQPDAKTIVSDIREGVTWSDGEAFTAEDVVFTYSLLKEFPALDSTGVWSRLESLSADGQTVTFVLQAEDSSAPITMLAVPIVAEHLWADVADPVTFTNDDPIGTGPYTLGDFNANQYKLEKNPDYWQADKVAADELVLPAANSQLDVVNNGYDWAYAFMSDVENTWVAADEGNQYWFPAAGTVAIAPNLTKAPYNDPNFREGMSLALKRDSIADNASEGTVGAAGQQGLLLPTQAEWLTDAIPDEGMVTQDTDAAEAAFAKAGFTSKGGKLVDADGVQAKMTITTPNGWTDWLRAVQEIQKQYVAIGIDVKINQPQPAAYFQAVQNGDFDVAMTSFGGNGSVYQGYYNLLSSDFLQPIGTTAPSNYQRYSNPEVDRMLTEFRTTVDADRQKELAGELQEVMYNDLPVISVYYAGLWGLVSDKSFTGWPDADNPYMTPTPYTSAALVVLTTITKANG
ncbi:peptide ABC transporter substrate-binding protein [Cryobacterium sp. LW097]|uniref:ABC transporter substrate-binding protein n=1 Tax=unclassified Cryobacterium TaxID=2649013 RepID=UPI000B4D535C|nr:MULTISPECIES: ABC transporter substrate-binding protein [unclassified Cryobacterium]ASD23336.1 peptide ABC transporter substrate-binding protein [Cryobacterium sp. LW097]TFC56677.1 ABC transporter substrate-binding protein [Cryobacterium sp. TMB3-1-2]TFC61132.1 ABC transporter substrate-binding protein [Cryobacterium sp. TMB1-7]TFC72183.1 ABC transporter substrate-binding protein [Cryobacterium sp. TMB3-15]TFC78806.1 ABC transporter substrate-binding protein [Cryobacterium sp. TMB3-10]